MIFLSRFCIILSSGLFLSISFAAGFAPVSFSGRTSGCQIQQWSSSTALAASSKPNSWWPPSLPSFQMPNMPQSSPQKVKQATPVPSFSASSSPSSLSLLQSKLELVQVGAAMDRGQSYNPTSGEYYADRMAKAKSMVEKFLDNHPGATPKKITDIQGEWELVFTTVPHGIFRSSPFFLAIQEAYEVYAQEKDSFGMGKADLFFKLHELQTCSWGASKIGRVAQTITSDYLYSEFDTSIFSLTVIPILGWFKLLPTFGGCVVTAAKAELVTDSETKEAVLNMIVDYTTARKVPGLNGLGKWIWDVKVPVGAIWKLLPWNNGREATCKVFIRYCDPDFRIVEDVSGDYFVYVRPVLPRPLDLSSSSSSGSSSSSVKKATKSIAAPPSSDVPSTTDQPKEDAETKKDSQKD